MWKGKKINKKDFNLNEFYKVEFVYKKCLLFEIYKKFGNFIEKHQFYTKFFL